MDSQQTTCRIQVQCKSGETSSDYVTQSLKDVKGAPDMTEKLKLQWVKGILEAFSSSPSKVVSIRPFDILLHHDGSVEALSFQIGRQVSYPSRFRIPPFKLQGLDEAEKVKRVEKFALGSLLYEVITTNEPFEQLSDDEVQDHYSRGAFPEDVFSIAMGPYILGCWSHQFEKEMEKLRKSFPVGTGAALIFFTSRRVQSNFHGRSIPRLRQGTSLPPRRPDRRRSSHDSFTRRTACSRRSRVWKTWPCRWLSGECLASVAGACTSRERIRVVSKCRHGGSGREWNH